MKYILILSILSLAALTGCNKFLDVRPVNLVFEDELFQDRNGFENALAGVYDGLGEASLYGRELRFGLMDAMTGYWTIAATGHVYSRAFAFDFKDPATQTMIDSIWSGLYQSVNKVNHILKNIDNIKDDPYYSLIKGEALGLRGYLHLELLRLFGPVISQDGVDGTAIPYYREVRNQPQPFLSTRQVLDLIEADLSAAEQLLKEDPITSIGREADENGYGTVQYNSLVDRRGIRMNYYAVLATKARKSLWEGDLPEAYARAAYFINEPNPGSRFINNADIASSYRRVNRFTPENIWGLYIADHRNALSGYLPDLANLTTTSSTLLLPQYTWLLNNLYNSSVHGSTNDYRLLNWFALTSTNQRRFVKLEIDPEATDFYNQYEVGMITLPEMYLIAAEAKVTTDPGAAIAILNVLRQSRNLTNQLVYDGSQSTETIMGYIIDEARKNFIGEGYTYLMYKRMYRPLVRPTGTIAATPEVMRFPVPVDEAVYNQTGK